MLIKRPRPINLGRKVSLSFAAALIPLIHSGVATAEVPDVASLLRSVVESRRAIETGELRYRLTKKDADPDEAITFDVAFDYRDGKQRLRYDTTRRKARIFLGGEQLHVPPSAPGFVERLVRTDDLMLYYCPDEYTSGYRCAATIQGRGKGNNEQVPYWNEMTDPRVLGLTAEIYGHLYLSSLDDVLSRIKSEETTSAEETPTEKEPRRLICLRARPRANVSCSIWIAPEQGNSIVRYESHVEGEKGFVSTMEADVENAGEKIWFPKSITVRRTRGNEVLMVEQLKVIRCKFNHDVDPRLFTLAGLDLRAGTSVMENRRNFAADWVWDGEKLVAAPKE